MSTWENTLFVNIRDNALAARNVEALLFVNMGDDALLARNMEALLFVIMGDDALAARNVEALLFVNMGNDALYARNVEALLFQPSKKLRPRSKQPIAHASRQLQVYFPQQPVHLSVRRTTMQRFVRLVILFCRRKRNIGKKVRGTRSTSS